MKALLFLVALVFTGCATGLPDLQLRAILSRSRSVRRSPI